MAARRSKAKAKAQEPGFLEALKELAREKGVEEEVLFDAIEAALISAYKRNFGSAQNVRVVLDRTTGAYHVYAIKETGSNEVLGHDTPITHGHFRTIMVLEREKDAAVI